MRALLQPYTEIALKISKKQHLVNNQINIVNNVKLEIMQMNMIVSSQRIRGNLQF